MKNIPKKFYLQIGEEVEVGIGDYKTLTEVSWCDKKIHDNDIEYVLASPPPSQSVNWEEIKKEYIEYAESHGKSKSQFDWLAEHYPSLPLKGDAILFAEWKDENCESHNFGGITKYSLYKTKGDRIWLTISDLYKIFLKEHGLPSPSEGEKWISVKEKLPKIGVIVNFILKHSRLDVYSGFRANGGWYAFRLGEEPKAYIPNNIKEANITHWQSLPLPPTTSNTEKK